MDKNLLANDVWGFLDKTDWRFPKKKRLRSGNKIISQNDHDRTIPSPGKVYVMAPMTMYGKKSLVSRKRFLENTLPEANLLYPDELFVNNDDWLKRIHGIVSECDCGILVSPQNRIVGKGCFGEVDLLRQTGKPVFYLNYAKKILTREFSLCKLLGGDWISHALVEL